MNTHRFKYFRAQGAANRRGLRLQWSSSMIKSEHCQVCRSLRTFCCIIFRGHNIREVKNSTHSFNMNGMDCKQYRCQKSCSVGSPTQQKVEYCKWKHRHCCMKCYICQVKSSGMKTTSKPIVPSGDSRRRNKVETWYIIYKYVLYINIYYVINFNARP